MIVIDLGYKSIVLPRAEGMKLLEILEKAEIYERKYWTSDKRRELGMETDYTYHVYPSDQEHMVKLITDQHYQMAKLAGKPQKD